MFEKLPPAGDAACLIAATNAINTRKKACGLGSTSWSLAELCPTDADYEWLLNWASTLNSEVARIWPVSLAPYDGQDRTSESRKAAFGLVFTLFCAEIARRDAPEKTLWPHITEDSAGRSRFNPLTHRELFTQGYPVQEVKEAMEEAARVWGLRNVFGLDNTKEWLSSVYLQFGFTRRSMKGNLRHWIGGAKSSQAAERLRDGSLRSATFNTLWNSLCDYRRGNITEPMVRARLSQSPWVLPEWYDELLHEVMRANLPASGTSNASRCNEPLPFLSEPVLQWSDDEPRFTAFLQNVAQQEWTEPSYELKIPGGQTLLTLVRQPDEGYAALPAGAIVFPSDDPEVMVQIVAPDGTSVALQTVLLYQENDISIFRASDGMRVRDAYQTVLSGQPHYLLVPPALLLSPLPPAVRWTTFGAKSGRLYYVPPAYLPSLVVLEGEQEFWRPLLSAREVQEADWLQAITVHWRGTVSFVDDVPMSGFCISGLVNGTRAAWVCVDGQHIDAAKTHPLGMQEFSPLAIFTNNTVKTVQMRVERETNDGIWESKVIRRSLWADKAGYRGLIRRTDKGWRRFDRTADLSVAEAKKEPVRLIEHDSSHLVEGGSWFGVMRSSVVGTLGEPPGWGTPLTCRPSVYNAQSETVLAASVYDTGMVTSCFWERRTEASITAGPRSVRVGLRRRIAPGKDYQLLWWDANGTTHWADSLQDLVMDNENAEEKAVWLGTFISATTEPMAIGVFYEGVCQGAWWVASWADSLITIPNPQQTAALLRALKMPVCASRHQNAVRGLLQAFPSEVLAAWTGSAGLPPNVWHRADEAWKPLALRTLLRNWTPTETVAAVLCRSVGGSKEAPSHERISNMLGVLLGICPFFAARTMLALWRHYAPQADRRKRSFRRACYRMLGLSLQTADHDPGLAAWKRCMDELYTKAAQTMSVGNTIIDPHLLAARNVGLVAQAEYLFHGQSIPELHERNIGTAVMLAPALRELVAAKLLENMWEA